MCKWKIAEKRANEIIFRTKCVLRECLLCAVVGQQAQANVFRSKNVLQSHTALNC